VGDLEAMLAAGNVTVTTTASGIQATNIDVTTKLGWAANTLTLDSYQSLSVTVPVTIKGNGGLSILTNDGGNGGELAFFGKGHVTFKKLSGKLSINGVSYRLVNSIASLASAIENKPSGDYALADNYDASKEGAYSNAPITQNFTGVLEGLGNAISNLTIRVDTVDTQISLGLFASIGDAGEVSDLGLLDATVSLGQLKGKGNGGASLGTLAATSSGFTSRIFASGTVTGPRKSRLSVGAGGLVGGIGLGGVLQNSRADVNIRIGQFSYGGGIAGTIGGGSLVSSYATGGVTGLSVGNGGDSEIGGLVGFNNGGLISNSYASGQMHNSSGAGGLLGRNLNGYITAAYSTGGANGVLASGGLIGGDESHPGNLSNTYWDMDTSGIANPSQGAGSPANDPGITGLTTQELQSGLPAGFDPTIWGEGANINKGLPYLLSNPPGKK
jgi:hypothetical protein